MTEGRDYRFELAEVATEKRRLEKVVGRLEAKNDRLRTALAALVDDYDAWFGGQADTDREDIHKLFERARAALKGADHE